MLPLIEKLQYVLLGGTSAPKSTHTRKVLYPKENLLRLEIAFAQAGSQAVPFFV